MRRRWLMRPLLQRRTHYGQYERLMSELDVEDPAAFKNFILPMFFFGQKENVMYANKQFLCPDVAPTEGGTL